MKNLKKIFSNPLESLSIFPTEEIEQIESLIYEKDSKLWIKSISRGEELKQIWSEKKSAPEEIVRQLYLLELTKKYKYPKHLIDIEKSVKAGGEIQTKRADIVIYRKDNITPHLIAEIKEPKQKNDIEQLKSYLNVEGAPFGVGLNGKSVVILYRPYPKDFDTLSDIPKFGESIDDVLNKRKKITDLELPKQLQEVIKNMEELVLAHTGFESFDEIFKLIYAKLHDEKEALDEEKKFLDFKKSRDAEKTKKSIDTLFHNAKDRWKGVFEKSDVIKLKPEHLSICVGFLEDYRLLGSNLEVIDKAFEYLIPAVAKSKQGQYFTPRNVIDMCIEMMNPMEKEKVIDTACGSAGFLLHTMDFLKKKHSWNDKKVSNYAKTYLYGIDFEEKASKIARAMMLIAGDGKTHIYKEDSLDSGNWEERTRSDFKSEELLQEFDDFEKNNSNKETFHDFNFDILMANPPFAGDFKNQKTIAKYELGKHLKTKKILANVSRDILFIERNLDFIKDGGRMAIVLPQSRLNNTTDARVREFIMDRARLIAVVGLDGNTFKPHTGTKTSVLFVQKWDDKINPKVEDYPIFMAVSENSGKDNSGREIWETNANGERLLDEHNHLVQKHDLQEIASAFEVWAKEQKLSFWR